MKEEIINNLDTLLEELGTYDHIYCQRVPSDPNIDFINKHCSYTTETSYAMNRVELAKYIVDLGFKTYVHESDRIIKFDIMNEIVSNHNSKLEYFLEENLK